MSPVKRHVYRQEISRLEEDSLCFYKYESGSEVAFPIDGESVDYLASTHFEHHGLLH